MIPIKDNYKFGTDPTMEDEIRRTNNWIYELKINSQTKFYPVRNSGPTHKEAIKKNIKRLSSKMGMATSLGERNLWIQIC